MLFISFFLKNNHPIEYVFYIFTFIVIAYALINIKKKNVSFPPNIDQIKGLLNSKFIRIQSVIFLTMTMLFILFFSRNSDKITFHRQLMDLTIEKIEQDSSIKQSFGDFKISDLPAKKDVIQSVDSNMNKVVYLKFYLRASMKSRYVESWLKLDTLNNKWVVEKYRILDRGER